ncbi:MAG: DNA mismatch repair protein MutT, partial [Paraglaciecola sp.]|nr:DNA mismatch repair protein MutT [Paraglaciecola sp.]
MLAFEYNQFNGIIINSAELPQDVTVFSQQLTTLLSHAKTQKTSVIWLTLAIDLAALITIATTQGFTFHNCLPNEVTLVFKSKPEDFAPFVP